MAGAWSTICRSTAAQAAPVIRGVGGLQAQGVVDPAIELSVQNSDVSMLCDAVRLERVASQEGGGPGRR